MIALGHSRGARFGLLGAHLSRGAAAPLSATRRALVSNSFTTTATNAMVSVSAPDSGRKSNGTNTTFNVTFGQTAVVDLANPAPAFVGWCASASGEIAIDNAIAIHAQIEYAGTFYDCGSFTLNPGDILKEAPVKAPITIPAGARYRVHYFGSVTAGQYFYQSICFASTNKDVFAEIGVGLADKSGGNTLTGVGINVPGHFVGCMADVPASHKTDILYGDSLMGSTDTDPMTQALRGARSFVKMAYTGSSAAFDANVAATDRLSTYRLPFIAAAGISNGHCDLGINDLGSGNKTADQLKEALETIIALLKTAGAEKVYLFTITPQTTIVGPPSSDVNQTVHVNLVDGRRGTHNSRVIAGTIAGMDGYWDWAAPAQNAGNADIWPALWSNDGLHFYNVANIGAPAKSAQTLCAEYLRTVAPVAV